MATRLTARRIATLKHLAVGTGAMAGVGGFIHGIGEVLQGSGPPGGVVFDSWIQGRIATNLGGEPAMTLIPNTLATGLLTMAASLAVVAWALRFLDHRYGGRGLAALSILMLLVGGGFGPPILGLLAALPAGAAHRRHRPPSWTHTRGGRALAAAWPTLFWICLADAAFLVFGSVAAGVVLNLDISAAFVYALFLAITATPLATLAGIAHDATHAQTVVRSSPRGSRAGTSTPA